MSPQSPLDAKDGQGLSEATESGWATTGGETTTLGWFPAGENLAASRSTHLASWMSTFWQPWADGLVTATVAMRAC